MVTIDGTTIQIGRMQARSVRDNSLVNISGSNSNLINGMGLEGLVINLRAWATSRSDYNTVMSKLMQSGEISLIVDSGWEFRVYPNVKTVERIQGTVDYFPFSVTLITTDAYEYTTSTTTRTKTISTNGQTWSADNGSDDITTAGTVETNPDVTVSSTGADEEFFAQTNRFT